MIEAALAAWPELTVDAFRAHLDGLPSYEQANLADLALAFAATSGLPSAVRELTERVEGPLLAAVTRAGYTRSIGEDATQETLILLLVDGQPLRAYQGRAPLVTWAKTIALRIAARLHAAQRDADQRPVAETPVPDMVMASIRKELHGAVDAAFRAATRTLSMFDRELLRAALVEGASIDLLARRHEVHRATAARWIGRARRALDEALRAELGRALSLDEAEVSSVLRAVQTSLVLPLEPLDD